MKKSFLAIAVALVLLGASAAQELVKVRTASEFVDAIAPGRTIELAAGVYDLSSAAEHGSEYVSWDRSSGEPELVIEEVEELSISGAGAKLLVSSPYVRVLTFRGCSTVALRDLAMGHEVSEPCMAGVLRFEACADMIVEDCELYGSGAVGLELSSSNGVEVSGGAIRGCNAGAVWIDGSWNVTFSGLEVSGNSGGYPLFRVDASNGVCFAGCRIVDNEGDGFFSADSATDAFGFEGCFLSRNYFESLSYEESAGVYFFEVDFKGNSFDAELEALAEYGGVEDEGPRLAYYEIEGSGLALEYPEWLLLDDSDPACAVLDEGEAGSGGIRIFKVYVLKKGEDPDTQATRIFKSAAPLAEKQLAQAGLRIARKSREEPVNTEAPPYHFEYYAEGQRGGEPVAIRVKLIHGRGAIWCAAAYDIDSDMIAPGSIYGFVLDSLMASGDE